MKYLLIILASTLALSSCNLNGFNYHKLECPTYDPTFLNTWFPYEEGETYYYSDGNGNANSLTIHSIQYYNGDEQEGCVIPDKCYASGVVFANRDIEQEDKIWMNASHSYGGDRGEEVSINWNSIHVFLQVNEDETLSLNPVYYDRPEEYYQEIKPALVHHDNIALNEVSYSDVYEITFNKNELGNARKIYLVKHNGVVGYETQDGSVYWRD